MTNQVSKYLPFAVVALIIIAVGGIQYFKNQKPVRQEPPQKQNLEQTPSQNKPASQESALMDNFEGILKISDNLKRGNLMLVNQTRVIYLFTSRDYSQLFDKQVRVEIDGSLENFRLVDIKAKE